MSPASDSLAERLRSEIDRSLQRSLKGLEFLSSEGPAVGLTPRELLIRRGTMALYHYHPLVDDVYRVPLLLVMALTNRGYILDLAPGQSLIEFLLRQGYDVYILDWNPPRSDEKTLAIADYVLDFLPSAVARVQEESGEEEVNLVGYCMGGLLSTLYLTLHVDGPVRNFAAFTTPIDFSGMKLFAHWSSRENFDVDRLLEQTGNAPPDLILSGFDALRPADRTTGTIQVWDNMWNDEYVKGYRMFDRWANDILPLPGAYFRQFTQHFMQQNDLVHDRYSIEGRPVRLKKITIPVFHALAQHDHIVPYEAAQALVQKIGSRDKEEVVLKGGHVSLVAGANAIKRLWPRLDQWLGPRST